jgi:histidinol phosphatase-like PHP family hydrolase
VERVSRLFPDVRVSIGCEAKALDYEGTLDASEDTIQLSDIVLGSVHRFPDGKGGYIPLHLSPLTSWRIRNALSRLDCFARHQLMSLRILAACISVGSDRILNDCCAK